MSLHHNHAITVMRIVDRFLDEGDEGDEGDEEDEEDEEDESGNRADRRICILYTVVNLRLAIGIRTCTGL